MIESTDIGRLRAVALEAGTQFFNGPDERAVKELRDRVFVSPEAITVAGLTPELTLCRLALAARAVAKAMGLDAGTYWAHLKLTVLRPHLEANLTTPEDRQAWDLLEGRLIHFAFGD